jgi:hypothetical protein
MEHAGYRALMVKSRDRLVLVCSVLVGALSIVALALVIRAAVRADTDWGFSAAVDELEDDVAETEGPDAAPEPAPPVPVTTEALPAQPPQAPQANVAQANALDEAVQEELDAGAPPEEPADAGVEEEVAEAAPEEPEPEPAPDPEAQAAQAAAQVEEELRATYGIGKQSTGVGSGQGSTGYGSGPGGTGTGIGQGDTGIGIGRGGTGFGIGPGGTGVGIARPPREPRENAGN